MLADEAAPVEAHVEANDLAAACHGRMAICESSRRVGTHAGLIRGSSGPITAGNRGDRRVVTRRARERAARLGDRAVIVELECMRREAAARDRGVLEANRRLDVALAATATRRRSAGDAGDAGDDAPRPAPPAAAAASSDAAWRARAKATGGGRPRAGARVGARGVGGRQTDAIAAVGAARVARRVRRRGARALGTGRAAAALRARRVTVRAATIHTVGAVDAAGVIGAAAAMGAAIGRGAVDARGAADGGRGASASLVGDPAEIVISSLVGDPAVVLMARAAGRLRLVRQLAVWRAGGVGRRGRRPAEAAGAAAASLLRAHVRRGRAGVAPLGDDGDQELAELLARIARARLLCCARPVQSQRRVEQVGRHPRQVDGA